MVYKAVREEMLKKLPSERPRAGKSMLIITRRKKA
jgi:hypothetical protein